MAARSAFIALFATLIPYAFAVTAFSAPPAEGEDVLLGSSYRVSWLTDWPDGTPVILTLWQDDGNNGWATNTLVSNKSVMSNTYDWNAQTIGELPLSAGFHFQLVSGVDVSKGPNSINSGAVFLKETLSSSGSPTPSDSPASSKSTASSSKSESTSITTSSPINTGPSPSAPAPSQGSTPNVGGGDSTNVTAIAIASTFGTLAAVLFIILATFFFKRDKNGNRLLFVGVASLRRDKSEKVAGRAEVRDRAHEGVWYDSPHEMPTRHEHEMPVAEVSHELPGYS